MSNATLTDTDIQPVVNEASKTEGLVKIIEVHEKSVLEEEMVDDFESTDEQKMPHITTDMKNNTYTPHDVSQEISEVVEQLHEENSESGSPDQVHAPLASGPMEVFPKTIDNEGEGRQMKDTEAAEEIKHDVEVRCSPEISHREVSTDLLTESTDETGEYGKTDMSHATFTDTDVQPFVNDASKTEGLVEMIEVHGKSVLEDETVDDFESTDEKKMPHITTDMQNNTHTHHDVSQEMSEVVEELDEDNNENGSPRQVHAPLTSDPREIIPKTIDNEREERKRRDTEDAEEIEHDVEEKCSDKTPLHKVTTELLTESQSDVSELPLSMLGPALEKEITKSTDETGEIEGIDRSSDASTDIDVHAVDHEVNKAEGLVEVIGVHGKLVEENMEPKEDQTIRSAEDSTTEQHLISELSSKTAELSLPTYIQPSPVTELSDSKTDDGNDHENVEMKITELHPQSQSKKKKRFGSTRKPQGGHRPDNEGEERQLKDTEAAEEIEHDVEERCSEETTRQEVTTDLLTESQSDVSELPLSMLGPALEIEIAKSTDETGEIEGIDRSSDASTDIDVHAVDHEVNKAEGLVEVIGVHGKLVEENMEPKEDQTICSAEDPTTEHVLSELSSETAELSLTSNTQLSILTELSESKSDDGNDLENVEMKITELHPQSQSKKKKRFGSTRKPQGGHRPDNEGEERQLKDTEAAEEIEHDVEEICSAETSHHEVPTDLLTESTDETEEYRSSNMLNATVTDTDVQPIVCEASKTEGLVEMINVHEKPVLEDETVDDSDEQKMPHITTDMQNETSTLHDVSQEISEVVEEHNEDNNESGSPNQVHFPLKSGPVEIIHKTIDNKREERKRRDTEAADEIEHDVEERCSEETTRHEVPTDLLTESQSDVSGLPLSMLGPALEKEITKSTDETGEIEGIDRSSDASTDIDVHAVDHEVNKAEGLVEVIGVHGKLVEESMEPKEDQTIRSAEDPTTEQHVLSELSSETAELSLTSNTQLSILTELSESKSDDGNDLENVEMKITELHPQSQSKKKKRFGSTRKPQGGHRPDNEEEERQLKHTETAEEIEHDVEERYSEENTHHELITDLPDMSNATLTDTDVQPIVCEASKTEGLVEIINVHEKTVLEGGETVDGSDEQKMPHINIDMQNETSTPRDVSQEISEVVEELDEDNNESGSPNQVHSPLTSVTVEVIPKTIDKEEEERKRRDTEAAEEIEHDVEERCSDETTHHEVTTDLLTESQSDVSELPLSMLGPALEKEMAKSTDEIGVHGELVEESMVPKEDKTICSAEDPTTEQHVLSELSSQTAELSLTTNTQLSTVTKPSESKPDDGNDHENVDMKITELHPQSQSKKKKRFGSTRKPQGGHRPDNEGEERQLKDTEAVEEIEHDVEEICSSETFHHEVPTDLLIESTDETGEHGTTDMSHATLTDTDVQPIVCEASKTEGLVEIINVHEKPVLEYEKVDGSDEQKMPHINIDMQNETSTLHDVSQEISEVVEELDEYNNESGSPNQVHSPLTSGPVEVIPKTIDKEEEERKRRDTEAAEEIEHDVEERCSDETTHHEVTTDLLTESQSDVSELPLSMLGPALEKEMAKSTDEIGVHGELVEESMVPKEDKTICSAEDPTTEQHVLSELSSQTAELSLTTNTQLSTVTKPSESKPDDGNDHENVDMKITELHPQSQSKKKKRFGSTRKPQGGHRPDNEGEERQLKDTEAVEEIEHDVEEICSSETFHHEVPTDLLIESTDETGEHGTTDMSHATLTDTDVQPIVCEASKTEGLVEMIEVHEKSVLEDETVNDFESTDEQKMPHITTDMQNNTSTHHDVSQDISEVVEELYEDNNESGSPNQVHVPLTSGTVDVIPKTIDNEREERKGRDTEAAEEIEHDVEERCSDETTRHEVPTDLLNETQSDVSGLPLSMLGPALEKEIAKSTDNTGQCEGIDRSSDASTDIDVHAVDHGVNKAEGLVEVIGVHGKLIEESMEPKEDQTICSAEDFTTEQHVLSELSSTTAELSLTTNIQPSPVTELSDSKTDDGNDHENVEMKITELHPQSQSKKKKRFGSTRKPQGGHRPDHEEEERQLKDAEAAEEIEHDVEKRCSPETSHHEVPTNLLTESTDETGEHGTTDKSNATLTDTDVQPVVNEASKTEGLVEMIRIHEKSLLEDEKFDNFESTDKQKMPHISTDMQNNTHTHHDVSQEISEVVDEDNRENGSPNQVHAPLTSGTEEFITETHDSVDIPVNTENRREAISDLTGQIPQDHSTSEDNLEKTTHKESENTTTLIHTQESVPIQDNVITETPELSTSGKRRTRRSHREQLYGGDKEKINISEINKEKRYIEKNDLYLIERSCISGTNAAEKLTEEETMEPEEEISNCPTEDPTTKDFTALGSEQHLLSELSFQTADLSLTTNIQPSPVTETSDSKTDGNDHENVEIKITELHPQSQNKKKKRFGSTRRPQGGHRPDNEGEKRKWKDTEAAGEIEHDVEERCSPEISHHESTADLLTKSQSDLSGSLSVINPSPEKEIADSTNKTGECERFHMPFVALTDTVVHTVDHDVSKEDRLLENSEGHGKPVLEIKKVDETESSEVNTETHDRVGIPVNAENIHAITPDQIKQFLHHDISEVHPEEPTDREPESTSLGIHIQEIKTTEGSAIAHNPELSTSGKRRKIGSTRRSHREQLHGGGRKTINEKEENICEKDKNRNFEDTKNVNEEQSMEAKEEESTIHTEDPTTDDFPAVCSEHVLSESSSQTAELSLSTNIQPSPLTEHPDDGNDHENVELKITELHPQSQSKKKKRFGSTRKPQGGHRPDNEEEERKWKDTEAAEETENDVEERCSKETTHYEISTDLLIESQSDMSEPSLSMLDPPLEKVTAESSDETGECGGVDLPAEKPVQITDVHHKLVLEVEKVDDSKSSEINVQIQDSIELEKPTNIIQSHTSTDSLIHTQESNTIQDNVIPESSELSTSGKKRKIGSTRRSHREQLHGRDKKKINEEEENQGAKDEEERYGEESAFNLADRSIKSGTQIVIEEESMPAKEEIGASQTEDPTTENVCSEQHVLSELSSQTAELILTTNIQPSPVSESKTDEDGNDHENVKMKITELHPQSQSKKKKRFGSTRKPQGGHRPDNEEEERQLKDTEAAEETEHGVEERCSQETTHYDISTDLMIESQSDLSGFSLCMIDPSLEKETQLQNAATDLHLQDFKNLQCIVISEKGSNPKEQHLRDDQKEATEELKEEGTTKELELEESTAVTQEASLEAETLRNLNCTSNAETAHPSIATELSVPADSVNLVIPEAEKMDKKRRKMGSTRRSYKGADRKEVLGETGGKDPRADEDMEDTLLHDTASGWGITANTTGQDTEPQIHHMFDKSEGSLLNEIEFELNMSCQLSHTAPAILESSVNNTLSPYNSSENSQPAAEQCRSSSELQHSQNSQIQAEISSPARRRKMGSTRKTPRNKQTEDMKDDSLETEHQAENLDKIELEREKAKDMLTVKMTEDKKESVELTPKVHDSSASTELPPPGSKRKFGSRRTAKGSRNLGGLPPDEFEPNQEKTEDAQVLSDELTVCDPYFTSGPQSTPVCQPVEDDNMEASLGKEHVNNSAVNEADVSAGLVSLDDLRKSALYNGSTGKREKIDFERWSEQIPDFGVAVYNVVMVGNSSVGKTSFMNRLQSGHFSPDYCSTIGVDTCVQNITLGGRTVKLHVWDTAGQERYHSITRQVFHKAQGLLLMYDITSSESFCAVRNWVTQIKECAPDDVIMILLGNKNDCAERKVQLQEGEDLSREYKIHFLECSAATGENVEESMKTLACLLVKQNVRREEDQTILQPKPPKQKSGCC
ncbi:uncharacterized protein rab44 isoform X2 [Astyanax mexicanus]|uniref:uncharacterized protein rab44 isoform X2 n=1 Tax=Astyanax mexicanus TaxID=7994 RepID=UPI0020CB5946|nr:uncharacterized protein rab44 isoform X2 [Astyanax mexicanus]